MDLNSGFKLQDTCEKLETPDVKEQRDAVG